METCLNYQCPNCSGEHQFELKDIDTVLNTGELTCNSCNDSLVVSEDGYELVKSRREEFLKIAKKRNVGIFILFISSLLEFAGVIPVGVLILGFIIAGIVYLSANGTPLDKQTVDFSKPV